MVCGQARVGNRVAEAFDEIVIAIPSLDPEEREALVHLCRATGKTTRVMQPVSTTFLQ